MSASGISGGVPSEVPAEHPFPDWWVAAVELAARLERFRDEAPIVLGLEPGGVPVG
jgi:predicted phosphoribosyltransferase